MDNSHSHPTPKDYLIIGALLTVATIIEIWATDGAPGAIRVPLLLILTVIKAALVAGYFMHLKMDSRLYILFFCIGIFVFALPFTMVMIILLG